MNENALNPVALSLASNLPMLTAKNYPRALALRSMAVAHVDLPHYLLFPEISALLHYEKNWHRHALFNLLWNTGARINEALALRRRDFRLHVAVPYVVLRTAKQRRAGAGRPAKGKQANRIVPLTDPHLVEELQRLFASVEETFQLHPVTRSRTPLPVWTITARTARNWLTAMVDRAARDGIRLSIPVTPHTFRHSFAMHLLYQGTPLKIVQGLMGHEKAESTEVYTRIFALDVVAERQVRFTMPGGDAVAMLRQMDTASLTHDS
ncbi:site-specific integrase [Serratia nevei]|jgi:integrase|uniref:site-specific integrase n=1 Tax=Serratia nevei TaxID=2703794 RepID=UPI0011F2BE3A|nr:site-specific integrase [Serratia nevei]